MRKLFHKKAFTLAEVLITLGIIGIVAAMTIPTVLSNAQDTQYRSAWKKVFSALNQAELQVVSDNGGSIKGICADADYDCMKNLFVPYLRFNKNCPAASTVGGCWHNTNVLKDMSGATLNWTGSGLIINDGMYLLFGNTTQACNQNYPEIGSIFRCGNINLDVNGSKGPNVLGKDVFGMHVLENMLKPYGTVGDNMSNTCSTASNGYGCSTQYLYQ